MLLIDAGNSRVKWGWIVNGILRESQAVPRQGRGLPPQMLEAWRDHSPRRVVVSNVAGAPFATDLTNWCQQNWGLVPEFVSTQCCSCGVDSRYSDPTRLGVDRWLALVAVRDVTPVVVVDCGTAVTLDYLSDEGLHLGGVILPGLSLMQESLLRRAPEIRRGVSAGPRPGGGVLGVDTSECIEYGCCNAVVGGIEQTVAQWRQAYGDFRLVISGGDASVIQSLSKEEYHSEPLLVLRGLHIVANSK